MHSLIKDNTACVLGLVVLGILYAMVMEPSVIGLVNDDGIYLTGAKALAGGHGYTLLGVLENPALIRYPPLFSAVLAPFWLIFPDFPANIPIFKGLNLIFSLAGLGMLLLLGNRIYSLSTLPLLCLLFVVGFNFQRAVFSSVILYSEPLFFLLSTITLYCCHRLQTENKAGVLKIAILTTACLYTKSLGIILAVSIFLWLLLQKKTRSAGLYLGIVLLLCLPWILWGNSHPSSVLTDGFFLYDIDNKTYLSEYQGFLKLGNMNPLQAYFICALTAIAQLPTALFSIGLNLISESGFSPSFFYWLAIGLGLLFILGSIALRCIREKTFSPVGLYIACFLVLLPAWFYFTEYSRFLAMITPFIWLVFLNEVLTNKKTIPIQKQVFYVFCLLSVLTNIYWLKAFSQPWAFITGSAWAIKNEKEYSDYLSTAHVLPDKIPADGRLWSETGTYFFSLYAPDIHMMPQTPRTLRTSNEQELYATGSPLILKLLEQNKIGYLLTHTTHTVKPNTSLKAGSFFLPSGWVQTHPQFFEKIYTSPNKYFSLYKLKAGH